MKTIIKILGLPRTGTNLMHMLASLNFKEYVCARGEHDQHYLGWKHGLPQKIEDYLKIEELTNETIKFIFTIRDFESWKESYTTKHFNSWENPSRFVDSKKRVFVTPVGIEIYEDLRHLHFLKTEIYKDFAMQNPDKAIIVPFEDLVKDQREVVQRIRDKFNLELMNSNIFTIKKHLDSNSTFVDYRP